MIRPSKLRQMFLPNVPDPGPLPNRFDGSVDGFFTSARDADLLVAFAEVKPDMRVLEPAAGEGAIVHALMRLPEPPKQIVAVEMHEPFIAELRASCEKYGPRVQVVHADYFKTRAPTEDPFAMAILNPPYQKFLDVRFIEKSLKDAINVAALLLSRTLHTKRRAKVWNSGRITKIDFLSNRPDAFENGKPIAFKPMQEYVHVMVHHATSSCSTHRPLVTLA